MPQFERDLNSVKEEIRVRSDIVEIIRQYTALKQAGKNWTGLCPFHSERRPSFRVSPMTQTYRCWSCGEHGDVFTFIEKKENVDFMDALEFLARRAGIPFERRAMNPEAASERERMLALNQMAAEYYQDRLRRSDEAQAYLANRAILRETQQLWDLGYAPPEWEGLTFALERQGADMALAARLGLIKARSPGGGFYDTFRNRLIFPIHDIQGRIIAFGGRALGDDPAKYLNSEQSPLFDKSRTLYGLVFARKSLSATTPAVFVEGYVDVITAHQAGFRQCVATLGTSMTEEHARLLARYSPRVIICYDADAAGIKATLRGAGVWESIGVEGAEVRVARLPPGDDPDSLLRAGNTAAFQMALDNAAPRVDFEIQLALDRNAGDTEEARSQALAEIVPILAQVSSLTRRDKYVERIAHLHPAHRSNYRRAIEALLADVEAYSRQSQGGQSARDRGYPLTQQTNRGPMANEPVPPAYRPPTADGWGRLEPGSSSGAAGRRARDGRLTTGIGGPPGPALSPLSGPEKAERQLLRALFTPEWRSYLLSRLQPDLLITPEAREVFRLAARTPAGADGAIDPAHVLRQAEAQEADERAAAGTANWNPDAVNYSSAGTNSAKTSEFIREVLEDSLSVMSNEPLSEAALGDFMRRLRQYREQQSLQELRSLLTRDDLTPEQRQAINAQYHEKTRQSRGSPPTVDDDNG